MVKKTKTRIYIDGANLHRGAKSAGWTIDYRKLFVGLSEKFKTKNIFIFIGKVPENQKVYDFLEKCGFKLIFKEARKVKIQIKGNCDAELILKAVCDVFETDISRGILISNDGDFSCLINFWKEKKISCQIVSPNKKFCSFLLKCKNVPILFLDEIKHRIMKNPQ